MEISHLGLLPMVTQIVYPCYCHLDAIHFLFTFRNQFDSLSWYVQRHHTSLVQYGSGIISYTITLGFTFTTNPPDHENARLECMQDWNVGPHEQLDRGLFTLLYTFLMWGCVWEYVCHTLVLSNYTHPYSLFAHLFCLSLSANTCLIFMFIIAPCIHVYIKSIKDEFSTHCVNRI